MATDQTVLKHIKDLSDEEHRLFEKGSRMTDAERDRLSAIAVALDQYWDLLRQRRAKREFGQNPDEAELRPPGIVEKYQG